MLWLRRGIFDFVTQTLDVDQNGVIIRSLTFSHLGKNLLFREERFRILYEKA